MIQNERIYLLKDIFKQIQIALFNVVTIDSLQVLTCSNVFCIPLFSHSCSYIESTGTISLFILWILNVTWAQQFPCDSKQITGLAPSKLLLTMNQMLGYLSRIWIKQPINSKCIRMSFAAFKWVWECWACWNLNIEN